MTSLYLAQLNFTVGDIAGNAARIRAVYEAAKEANAELVVFSELCLIGYPPEDLIFTPKLRRDAMAAAHELAAITKGGPAMLLGCVWEEERQEAREESRERRDISHRSPLYSRLYNAAVLLDNGAVQHIQYKHHLPNYGVFDEKRVFERGPLPNIIPWRGKKLGVLICEDIWGDEAPAYLAAQQPDMIICINASPFEQGKQQKREALAAQEAQRASCPLIYLNQVGGQDELVFDGGSFVVDPAGVMVERLAFFEEEVSGVGFQVPGKEKTSGTRNPEPETLLYQAMQTGLRDYVNKNGFPGVVIGLSGGIDSALTAVICVDALGPEHVHCVMLPSPYTSQISLDDAAQLAENLAVRYDVLPIAPGMKAAQAMLATLEGVPTPVAFENIQSRLRGLLLMAISNSTGALLITTGNKSEMATGYATLYGDMCGAFSVLKDVYKTEVFALARWRNEQGDSALIPERTITRPPSAELRENQKDEDSLPPYEILDKILYSMVECRMSAEEIVAQGHERAVVERVAHLLYISEYKRRQAPPGVKLSTMAFGRDRRFPLTNRFLL